MNRISFTAGLAISITFLNASQAEPPTDKSVSIPLDQIWAYRMPGTKAVGELDAEKVAGAKAHPIVNEIVSALSSRPRTGQQVGPAIVVKGNGKVALQYASDGLTKRATPAADMPADTDLSLLFYSHRGGQFVHLVSVDRTDRVITVKYHFVAHATTNLTSHFALIPIGTFSPGVVEVKIEQQKSVGEASDERPKNSDSEHLVSQAFTFKVGK